MHQTRTKTIQEEIVICDRCHREMVPDDKDFEHQERIAIRFRAGYGSVFEEGNLVESDICQYCLQEVFGKYLRITDDDPFDPQHKLTGEAARAYLLHLSSSQVNVNTTSPLEDEISGEGQAPNHAK